MPQCVVAMIWFVSICWCNDLVAQTYANVCMDGLVGYNVRFTSPFPSLRWRIRLVRSRKVRGSTPRSCTFLLFCRSCRVSFEDGKDTQWFVINRCTNTHFHNANRLVTGSRCREGIVNNRVGSWSTLHLSLHHPKARWLLRVSILGTWNDR